MVDWLLACGAVPNMVVLGWVARPRYGVRGVGIGSVEGSLGDQIKKEGMMSLLIQGHGDLTGRGSSASEFRSPLTPRWH